MSGASTGFKILGIGGEGAYSDAMDRVRENAQLHDPNQGALALVNVTKDESSTW